MAINVSQAFHRTSANPVDESLALTKTQMLAVNDNLMPAKYLTVCQDDGAIYLYDKTNTPSVETGKFVKFEGGGGSITVDDAISPTSENPVQNKVIKAAIDTKYDTGDTAFTGVVDGDYFPVYDTSATTKKKTLWSNIKSLLKSYFDEIYSTISTRGTPTSGGTTLSVVNTGDMYAWNVNGTWYATSSTGASTTAKVATLARGTFTLTAGARVAVKFTYTNTASAPTLNVGSTGAKNIKYVNNSGTVSTPSSWWGAGDVVTFTYDGTQFLMQPTLAMGGSSYTAGDGIDITNNEISTDNMPAADMSEVISPLPGVSARRMKYSTEEQVIGEWIDNKPIYQKTISCGSIPTDTIPVGTEHNISNFKKCIKAFGYTTNGSAHIELPGYSDLIKTTIGVRVNSIKVFMECASTPTSPSNFTESYVTIQYTKTTD